MEQRTCECGEPVGESNKSGMCRQCLAEMQRPSPSPEEILAECAAIQNEWTRVEEHKRRSIKCGDVDVRRVHCRTPSVRGARE